MSRRDVGAHQHCRGEGRKCTDHIQEFAHRCILFDAQISVYCA
jgi:hypothetical protein